MIATFNTDTFIRNLRAALRCASTADRPHQRKVRIELRVGVARFVATNGAWLWLNEVTYRNVVGRDERGREVHGTCKPVDVHISVDDAKALIKDLDKGKAWLAGDVDLDIDTRTVQQHGKSVGLGFGLTEGIFPPYEQVIPKALAPTLKGKADVWFPAVDAGYVGDVVAAFNDIEQRTFKPKQRDKHASIAFQPCGGDLDPVVITSYQSTALVILMPQRQDRPQGAEVLRRYHGAPLPVQGAA
jgi:hypothetical protein